MKSFEEAKNLLRQSIDKLILSQEKEKEDDSLRLLLKYPILQHSIIDYTHHQLLQHPEQAIPTLVILLPYLSSISQRYKPHQIDLLLNTIPTLLTQQQLLQHPAITSRLEIQFPLFIGLLEKTLRENVQRLSTAPFEQFFQEISTNLIQLYLEYEAAKVIQRNTANTISQDLLEHLRSLVPRLEVHLSPNLQQKSKEILEIVTRSKPQLQDALRKLFQKLVKAFHAEEELQPESLDRTILERDIKTLITKTQSIPSDQVPSILSLIYDLHVHFPPIDKSSTIHLFNLVLEKASHQEKKKGLQLVFITRSNYQEKDHAFQQFLVSYSHEYLIEFLRTKTTSRINVIVQLLSSIARQEQVEFITKCFIKLLKTEPEPLCCPKQHQPMYHFYLVLSHLYEQDTQLIHDIVKQLKLSQTPTMQLNYVLHFYACFKAFSSDQQLLQDLKGLVSHIFSTNAPHAELNPFYASKALTHDVLHLLPNFEQEFQQKLIQTENVYVFHTNPLLQYYFNCIKQSIHQPFELFFTSTSAGKQVLQLLIADLRQSYPKFKPANRQSGGPSHLEWSKLWNTLIFISTEAQEQLKPYITPLSSTFAHFLETFATTQSSDKQLQTYDDHRVSSLRLEVHLRQYLNTSNVPDLIQLTKALGKLTINCSRESEIPNLLRLLQKYQKWFIPGILEEEFYASLLKLAHSTIRVERPGWAMLQAANVLEGIDWEVVVCRVVYDLLRNAPPSSNLTRILDAIEYVVKRKIQTLHASYRLPGLIDFCSSNPTFSRSHQVQWRQILACWKMAAPQADSREGPPSYPTRPSAGKLSFRDWWEIVAQYQYQELQYNRAFQVYYYETIHQVYYPLEFQEQPQELLTQWYRQVLKSSHPIPSGALVPLQNWISNIPITKWLPQALQHCRSSPFQDAVARVRESLATLPLRAAEVSKLLAVDKYCYNLLTHQSLVPVVLSWFGLAYCESLDTSVFREVRDYIAKVPQQREGMEWKDIEIQVKSATLTCHLQHRREFLEKLAEVLNSRLQLEPSGQRHKNQYEQVSTNDPY